MGRFENLETYSCQWVSIPKYIISISSYSLSAEYSTYITCFSTQKMIKLCFSDFKQLHLPGWAETKNFIKNFILAIVYLKKCSVSFLYCFFSMAFFSRFVLNFSFILVVLPTFFLFFFRGFFVLVTSFFVFVRFSSFF